MHNATLQNTHALIPNANQYVLNKQYVSVHSEDRDITKFPDSAEFEIELPQDYVNVVSTRLYSWCFPSNYNVFSVTKNNILMSFKMVELYDPSAHGVVDATTIGIFEALGEQPNHEYVIHIETGFYNPDQITTELTNKFNEVVTAWILKIFQADPGKYAAASAGFTEYDRFQIVYSTVGMKLWFGNNADQFIITNESNVLEQRRFVDTQCIRRNLLPDFSNWGLPAYLGFSRCNITAGDASDGSGGHSVSIVNGVPRFFFNSNSVSDGYWLTGTLPGATMWFLEPPMKINLMGPAYLYMEVDGMNCIDETSPWNMSAATMGSNQTNGVVRSSFAKMPIPTTPISQWFDQQMAPYKYFSPPAERIRRLKVKFRYHDGEVAKFGAFNHSFMIEFSLLVPNQERKYIIFDSQTLSTINQG